MIEKEPPELAIRWMSNVRPNLTVTQFQPRFRLTPYRVLRYPFMFLASTTLMLQAWLSLGEDTQ